MKVSTKYMVYTVLAVVLLNLTAGAFIFWGINPLLDQVDMQMSANFSPASKFSPILADDRPIILLGFFSIVGVSLVFTAVQLVLFRFQVVKPLHRLMAQAAQLAKGDFAVDLDPDHGGTEEIAELNRSFRFMRDRMQNYVNRLQASRTRESRALNRVDAFSHLKGDFLSNVSLELKNPLNAILGFANLIKRDIAKGHYDEELLRKCGIIVESAEMLNSFIDKLLSLSRLDSGQYVPLRQEIHTADFLQDVSELNRTLAENRRVAITCHYSPEQPDVILCDHDVLFNGISLLLAGMIRTSPVGSEVSFGCIRSGIRVIFWLKAPPAENSGYALASMYKKNFLSASATRPAHLSGALMLNLAVARSSFDIVNATVSVLGPDDSGSEFIISFNAEDLLPEHEETAHMHTASNLTPEHSAGRSQRREVFALTPESMSCDPLSVVLYDTDENTRKLLEHILVHEGHRLEAVYDEKSCLARVEKGCDLLIVDLQPMLRPVEMIKALAERLGGKLPYIVILSTYLEDSERQALIVGGADECWLKPLDVNRIFECFRRLGSGETGSRQSGVTDNSTGEINES